MADSNRRTPRARLLGATGWYARTLGLEALEDRHLLTLLGNTLFPANSAWNQKVNNAPVAGNSATLVSNIGANGQLHPDFGTVYQGALIGIPFNTVSGTQPKVNVVIDAYEDESDVLPVPIPANAVIEGDPLPSGQNDGDRHLIIYDKDNNIVYELFNVHRPSETSDGKWHADSEAVWDLKVNSFRTPGWTSADAAGLPILPGLVRPDEVLDQGVINHALRFTVPDSAHAYIYPASHFAGDEAGFPRMGERFRLKANFDISGFSAANRVILQALKDYGMIVADNGTGWYLSGEPSSRWNDDDLHNLSRLIGSNFEAVDLTPIVSSLGTTSGSTGGGASVTITGKSFSGAAGQLQVFFGATAATGVTVVSDTTVVVTAPAHAAGAVHLTVRTPYGTSATNAGDQFTYTTTTSSATVVGRSLFYRNSTRYDLPGGSNPRTPNAYSDDNAIATDKTAYLPNAAGAGGAAQSATFANVSSYDRGINGIMVDLAGTHGPITTADFIFKVGNNNTPSSWATAPAPVTVLVRAGQGVGGSDRIELIWADGAISKKWLEVIVKGRDATGGNNTNTGLAASDVFFFGSAPGDTGNGDTTAATVTNTDDELAVRNNPKNLLNNIPITNIHDFNRDGAVDGANDELLARNNTTNELSGTKFIRIGIPPAAPDLVSLSETDAGLSSALAGTPKTAAVVSGPAPPAWVLTRIRSAELIQNLESRSATALDALWADSGTPRAARGRLGQNERLPMVDEQLDELLGEVDLS